MAAEMGGAGPLTGSLNTVLSKEATVFNSSCTYIYAGVQRV